MRGIEQYLQVDAATLGALKYAGTWNASTNTPTLASGVGTQGQYYVVSVAGSTNLDGETNWQVGDWAVFNGSVWQKVDGGSTGLLSTLTVTGNTYLATTSGNVGIGTSSPAQKLEVFTSNATVAKFTRDLTTDVALTIGADNDGPIVATEGVNNLRLFTNATERMRIDSAGNVGIGTSSPGFKLDVVAAGTVTARVQNTASSADAYFQAQNTVATGLFGVNATGQYMYTAQSVPTLFYNAGAERMRLDTSGNLGLGVTPSAWISAYRALDIGNTASVYGRTDSSIEAALVANAYRNSAGNWIYKLTGIAGKFGYDTVGSWAWFTAPSGTAGNAISFTQAMTLDASGNLLVGSTSGPYSAANRGYINISGSTDSVLGLSNGASARGYLQGTATAVTLGATTGSSITFDINGEKARLDAAGNLGLGVTPSAWAGYKPLQAGTGASFGGYAGDVLSFVGSNTYNDNTNWRYIVSGNAAARYQQSAGVHAWYNAPSGTAGNVISFTQAMTLDASGNLLVGQTSSISGKLQVSGAGGMRVNEDGAGTKVVFLRSDFAGLGPSIQVSTADPLLFLTSNTERMRITAAGNIHTPAGATTMTNGFFYIPAAAGVPTGVPTAITGTVPMYYDTTNNKFYVYNGAWKSVALL